MGWILSLVLAAIGLVLCALILGDNFQLHGVGSFLWALLIFAILNAIIPWVIIRILRDRADTLIAITGFISALLSLIVTTWLSDLQITGFWTWVWASLIIWVLSMVIWVIPGPWRSHRRRAAAA
jgi:uncharacterized membrane protein YvlD (DUF360 family)